MDIKTDMERDLSEKRMPKLFIQYALPGVVAMLFIALQSIVDGLIVGRLIGADALAGINIVAPAYAIVTAIALILGVGSQAQLGLNLGSENYFGAKSTLVNGFIGLLTFTLLSTIFVNVFDTELVRLNRYCHRPPPLYLLLPIC